MLILIFNTSIILGTLSYFQLEITTSLLEINLLFLFLYFNTYTYANLLKKKMHIVKFDNTGLVVTFSFQTMFHKLICTSF